MIKKIIHVSDIHLRNFKRLEEYQQQLQKFINYCNDIVKDYGNENVRIVITGDLFHSKNEISNECYILASWFLRELDKICKTIVIAGNHDMNMQNLSRLDSLTTLFSMCNLEQTYYIDKELGYESGLLRDDNIVWCLYSSFDEFKRPDGLINAFEEKSEGTRIVGLYHGEVVNAKTDSGYVSNGKALPCEYFDNLDFCLCGHIHRRQNLEYNGIPIVYSGSLIQQDHGENISQHGFLIWDVEDCDYEEVNINNEDYGFYTFVVNNEEDINDNKEEPINL